MKHAQRNYFAIAVGMIFLTLSMTQCSVLEKDEDPATPDYGIHVYPENGSKIWGYQMISIQYNSLMTINISDVRLTAGGVTQSLITQNNPVFSEQGLFAIELNAEAIAGTSATVVIEFENNVAAPIVMNYIVNHMPVLQVFAEVIGNQVLFDASTSTDPDGDSLIYTWLLPDTTFSSPQITVPQALAQQTTFLIGLSDGTALLQDFLEFDATGQEYILLGNNLKCIGMEIAKNGPAKGTWVATLGPTLPIGTQLEVTNGKLTRNYVLKYNFEVRATLERSAIDLKEGQDVARTALMMHEGSYLTLLKSGQSRNPADRSQLLPGKVFAPFPDPVPVPPPDPTMVSDSYDHHPRPAMYYENTSSGMIVKPCNSKMLGRDENKLQIIWIDQPGWNLFVGTEVTHPIVYKAFFRSWMMPDLNLCQRYFKVEIEVDATGMVVNNQLTMIQ